MAQKKQPVSIDGIEFDALLDQSQTYEAEVPTYPTEAGFDVSDNIALKAETIDMTLCVTNTPITWRTRHKPGSGRVESVVKQLEELYYARKVFTVVTSDKVYENMVLTNMSISKSTETGYAREIPVTLQKIIISKSKTVTIPESYGKSGTTKAPAGNASQKSGSSGGSTASSGTSYSGGTSGSKSNTNSGTSQKNNSGGASVGYRLAQAAGITKNKPAKKAVGNGRKNANAALM